MNNYNQSVRQRAVMNLIFCIAKNEFIKSLSRTIKILNAESKDSSSNFTQKVKSIHEDQLNNQNKKQLHENAIEQRRNHLRIIRNKILTSIICLIVFDAKMNSLINKLSQNKNKHNSEKYLDLEKKRLSMMWSPNQYEPNTKTSSNNIKISQAKPNNRGVGK